MRARKRAPGGGRKPRGDIRGKSATLTSRITASTALALGPEAAASGRSISQVAERMIELGLDRQKERERDTPVKALCYIVAELSALICCFKKEDRKPFEWLTNPFMFEAFKLAIQRFMGT